jgi:hypothetical protein
MQTLAELPRGHPALEPHINLVMELKQKTGGAMIVFGCVMASTWLCGAVHRPASCLYACVSIINLHHQRGHGAQAEDRWGCWHRNSNKGCTVGTLDVMQSP